MAQMASPQHGASRQRRRGERETTSWVIGAVLIVLGVAFLLENAGFVVLSGNWWAVFIYFGALASLANAWRMYRARHEMSSSATGSLIWGLVLTVIATIFAFNLEWDTWWPAILVAIGIGIVVGYALRGSPEAPEPPAAVPPVPPEPPMGPGSDRDDSTW